MNKKSSLATVFLVVLVDLIGFGIVLPLLPFYAAQYSASPFAIGLLFSIFSLAQLIFSPLWGRWSDRAGRRPVMLISTLGASFSYVLFAFSHSLFLLFLSRLIAGVMGGNISTAQAYVADVTSHEDRAKGMGLIGAAFGLGFVLGPAITSVLIHPESHAWLSGWSSYLEANRYALPGFFAAFLSFVSFTLVLFFLPEPVHSRTTASSDIERENLFAPKFWKGLFTLNKKSAHHVMTLLFLSLFLSTFGQSSLYVTFPMFCHLKLGLTPEKVGMQFAYMGLVAVFVQGFFMKRLSRAFGERKLFLYGAFFMIAGIALIPFAVSEKSVMIYLAVLAVGGSLSGPSITSLISKESSPERVGAALGSAQSLAALGRVIGPAWGGVLFAASFQLPFFLTSAVLFLMFWAAWKLGRI